MRWVQIGHGATVLARIPFALPPTLRSAVPAPPSRIGRAHPAVPWARHKTATRPRNIFRKPRFCVCLCQNKRMELQMNGLIYLIGLIVVIMAVLSLLGLR
jgi:hypothetical protein